MFFEKNEKNTKNYMIDYSWVDVSIFNDFVFRTFSTEDQKISVNLEWGN